MSSAAQLGAGIAALGLSLPDGCAERLLDYLGLLKKWNKIYNLTAIEGDSAMVVQHLLDSLSVLPYLPDAGTLVDVGSGAGLPGLPLAIARPRMPVTLIEATDKKSAFQRQVKIELKLENVSIHSGRVEDSPVGPLYDIVISRAFAELTEFVRVAGHLVASGRRAYAMKGAIPTAEIARLKPPWQVVDCVALKVPGLAAQRHLIVLERS